MKGISAIYIFTILFIAISCKNSDYIIINKEINFNKHRRYGFSKTIKVKEGECYDILVQRKGNVVAELIVKNPKYNDFYRAENNSYFTDSSGWETMHVPVYTQS